MRTREAVLTWIASTKGRGEWEPVRFVGGPLDDAWGRMARSSTVEGHSLTIPVSWFGRSATYIYRERDEAFVLDEGE